MIGMSSEEWAKYLFGDNKELVFTPEQREHLEKEIQKMEERMKAVGFEATSEKVAEAVSNQTVVLNEPVSIDVAKDVPVSVDVAKDVPAPIPGINAIYGYPAAEVPDEATKAFVKALNTKHEPDREMAWGFLNEASRTMEQRAKLRDSEEGERTAAQIAKVFNVITGHELSESDAWMFLLVLKIVRSRNGKYNRDDYVDMAAYAGLLGECESVTRKK